MLCGIPCSGKSTHVKEFLMSENYSKAGPCRYKLLCTDNYIEKYAAMCSTERDILSYDDVFNRAIDSAKAAMQVDLEEAIQFNRSIIWDQTNLTPKVRKLKLKSIPDHYYKTAVYFTCDFNQALIDNVTRSKNCGKTIPVSVLNSMHNSFVVPTLNEGFDSIVHIDRSSVHIDRSSS